MKLSNHRKAVIALIITSIIWGAAPPIFKWTLQEIQPFTLAFLRFLIATILIFPFAKRSLKINPKDYLRVILLGIIGININIAFFFEGLKYTPSINTTIIASAGPVFIVLFALLFLKEKPKPRLILGTFLSLLGVFVFLVFPYFNKGGILVSFGNLLIVIATLAAVVHVIIGRDVMKRNNPLAVTFWMFLIGTLGFAPQLLNEINTIGFLPELTSKGILGIIFGGVFSSFIAYYFYSYALKFLSASDVGIFTFLDPIVTVLIAIPLLGEYPNLVFFIGSALVFGGIFLAEGRINYHPFNKLFKT